MGDKSFFEINVASAPKDGKNISISSDSQLMKRGTSNATFCRVWTLSVSLVSSLLLSYLMWNTEVFNKGVSQQLVLKNGTRMFETWSDEPVSTTFSVYLFNYTNVERFESGLDQTLKMEELGPYAYTVNTKRVNITFHPNGTVSYQDRKNYQFAPHLSKGSLSDELIAPNIPYMSAMNQVRDSYIMTRWMLGKALNQLESTPFIRVTAQQLLWGYDDKLFSIAAQVLKYQDQDIPFKEFGLFAGKNGTIPDVMTIFTGENDISKKGLVSRFNGDQALTHWSGRECNKLDSYPGSAMPPSIGTDTVYLYTKDACRRVPMTYRYPNLVLGIRTYHFELPEDFLSNEGENECFCGQTCLPAGVLNVSACAFGGPILISNPHFLHGDPILFKMLEGLSPDPHLHNMYLDIEPNLGIILDGVTTIQMNVMVRNLPGMPINSNYPDMLVLPVTWVKLAVDEFPTGLAWEVRGIVALYCVIKFLMFYGPLMLAAFCIALLIYRQCRREKMHLPESPDSSVIVDSRT